MRWSYKHKVYPDSHIWFDKGRYSVPSGYINSNVDVKYSNTMLYIYISGKRIAEHMRLSAGSKNASRTDPSHLPYPQYTPDTLKSIREKAKDIGYCTGTVIERLIENRKVEEQAIIDIRPVLGIGTRYGNEILEEACRKALKDHYLISYNTLNDYVKELIKKQKASEKNNKTLATGIVRGADYYGR